MKKLIVCVAALGAVAVSTPAMAWGTWGGSSGSWGSTTSGGHTTHYCGCGDKSGDSMCNTTTSTTSTTTTSTSSGNEVPEPGMLGMAGAGLLGIAMLRRRKARAKA